MIEIIDKNKNLAELLSKDTSCIYFSCVLEDSMKGRVWADNLEKPSFAIVWNEYEKGFQLMGEPIEKSEYDKLRTFFETIIFQFLLEKELRYFECGTDSEELTSLLCEVFKDKVIDSEQQKVFGMKHVICPKKESVRIHNIEIVAIDASFFKREYDNIEYVTEEIMDTWNSIELYLESGYGYAAVIDNSIVSKALVTCSYAGQDNIGVDTWKEYRRQGISSQLVYNTVLEARKRDRECVWDCIEDNVASERTARKVGFELERTYTVCWFNVV